MDDELLTPPQVARYVQMSEDSLAHDRFRGKGIPYTKIGRRVRYYRSDVEAFLAANRVDVGGAA